ncbi:membrane protein [Salmonella enterica subsp. enterica]|uniref:Membrane protein n=1 Tax=Salmonella enterica I TaxID=59201 RepID=A0A379WJC2_SALET|nr:membrane protein [Salmonella enterica subsp. enterica]
MTIQQWLFSFKGRIGRRDFWIWIGLWFCRDAGAIFAGGKNLR